MNENETVKSVETNNCTKQGSDFVDVQWNNKLDKNTVQTYCLRFVFFSSTKKKKLSYTS